MSTVDHPNAVPILFEAARKQRHTKANATVSRLGAGNEHLSHRVPPVVDAGGEIGNAVHATLDVDVSLPRAFLQVAGVRVACGAGDVRAELVVFFRTCRDRVYKQIAVMNFQRGVR